SVVFCAGSAGRELPQADQGDFLDRMEREQGVRRTMTTTRFSNLPSPAPATRPGPAFQRRMFSLMLLSDLVLAGPHWPMALGQDADLVSTRVEALSDGKVPQSIDDLRALQARLKDLSQKLIPATVNVRVGPAQGSGVIISED